MIRILIAGGGGLGLEAFEYIQHDIAHGRLPQHCLGGVLSDSATCELVTKLPEVTYQGLITEYEPRPNDRVLITVGSPEGRLQVYRQLQKVGANLFTYVHSSAWVANSAHLGSGCMIAPQSIVNAGAHLGENVLVNFFCNVGHGARIGSHSVLSPYCALSGNSSLGHESFMGTRATLYPKIQVGTHCVIDAHTAVRQSAGNSKAISCRGKYQVIDRRPTPTP